MGPLEHRLVVGDSPKLNVLFGVVSHAVPLVAFVHEVLPALQLRISVLVFDSADPPGGFIDVGGEARGLRVPIILVNQVRLAEPVVVRYPITGTEEALVVICSLALKEETATGPLFNEHSLLSVVPGHPHVEVVKAQCVNIESVVVQVFAVQYKLVPALAYLVDSWDVR